MYFYLNCYRTGIVSKIYVSKISVYRVFRLHYNVPTTCWDSHLTFLNLARQYNVVMFVKVKGVCRALAKVRSF